MPGVVLNKILGWIHGSEDIIMYKSYGVPVGVDQAPHVEITREIARRFNFFYGNVFPEPRVILTETPKILGIDRRKMSKR